MRWPPGCRSPETARSSSSSSCSRSASPTAAARPTSSPTWTPTRAWVIEQNEENLATARAYLEGRGAFPERAALNQLAGRFLTDFYVMVAHWVSWASQVVDSWPDDVRNAPFDAGAAEEGVRLAESVAKIVE